MKLILPILDLSKDFEGMDLQKRLWRQYKKVNEEIYEYQNEKKCTDKACDEWYDIVQALSHLGMMEFTEEQIKQTAQRHYEKLASRDRKIVGQISISVEVD